MLIIILILILFDDSLPVDGAPPAKKRKADPFADLRDEKVNAVRSSTDGAPELVFFSHAAWNVAGVIHFGYC